MKIERTSNKKSSAPSIPFSWHLEHRPSIKPGLTTSQTQALSSKQWSEQLTHAWSRSKDKTLGNGIRLLSLYSPKPSLKRSVPGQPFDLHLLDLSPLYKKSRNEFILGGGSYHPTLNSSPRTLSSSTLLQSTIQYSPMDLEYIWSATDPLEKKKAHVLPLLRSWISNLFHEQNHRILWRFLPKPPQKGDALRKYLNFTESLVIALDMALSDQIGTQLASLFHLCGVVYDPGAQHPRNGLKHRTQTRQVRTYLHACTYATYLVLEHYEPKQIVQATQALFPEAGSLATLAAERSLRLDSEFVRVTNPFWQRQHGKAVSQAFQNKPGETLELPDDPMNSYLNYLWAERWFQKMGL